MASDLIQINEPKDFTTSPYLVISKILKDEFIDEGRM
jgi:hypothetical protein